MYYYARPIDFNTGEAPFNTIAAQIESTIARDQTGGVFYKPHQAFTIADGTPVDGSITAVNRHLLGVSEGMLAVWTPSVPSFGVSAEVATAAELGTPVELIVLGVASWAMQIPGVTITYIDPETAQRQDVVNLVEHAIQRLHQRKKNSAPKPQAQDPATIEFTSAYESELGTYGGTIPTRGYHDDAGFDIYVSEDTEITPGRFVDVPSNVAVALPDGVWGYLTGRSSTLRELGLLVNPGVIDTGYRGELFSGVWNLSDTTVRLRKGDRVAQLILMQNVTQQYEPQMVTRGQFSQETERGARGFGSTGTARLF